MVLLGQHLVRVDNMPDRTSSIPTHVGVIKQLDEAIRKALRRGMVPYLQRFGHLRHTNG